MSGMTLTHLTVIISFNLGTFMMRVMVSSTQTVNLVGLNPYSPRGPKPLLNIQKSRNK